MKILSAFSAAIIAVTGLAAAAPAAAQERTVVRTRTVARPANTRVVVRERTTVRHDNGYRNRTRRVCTVRYRNHRRIRTCRVVRW